MHRFEERLLFETVRRIVRQCKRRRNTITEASDWLEENGWIGPVEDDREEESMQRERAPRMVKKARRRIEFPPLNPDGRHSCEALLARLDVLIARRANVKPSPLQRALQRLKDVFDMDNDAVLVLGAMARMELVPRFDSASDRLLGKSRRFRDVELDDVMLSLLSGVRPAAAARCMADDGPLIVRGLIEVEERGRASLNPRIAEFLSTPVRGSFHPLESILGDIALSHLKFDDFDHVAEHRDYVVRLLKGALAEMGQGVNILVYGPPGTGKTEFCKVVAEKAGAPLYAVGEANEAGDEPNRHDRLADLRLTRCLLEGADAPGVILFDEADDLLAEGDAFFRGILRRSSKVFMHRLLEQTEVPIIWTLNSTDSLTDAVLRRMTYCVDLRTPPAAARARVMKRELKRSGTRLKPAEIDKLAKELPVAPGVAVSAMNSVRLARGDAKDFKRAVLSIDRAMHGGRPRPAVSVQDVPFDATLCNADSDVIALADRLSRKGATRHFSILLSGPPGTGKSAYVRYLAERLGLEVEQRRTSDLLSMWVGENEKNIAEAFSNAAASGSFLIFDEADSLLFDRQGARQSWEVSQVNEMLTWMESHTLPFACTTNLVDGMDRASLRRFTFKIKMDYLKPAQVRLAFKQFFNLEAPKKTEALHLLTPGDFVVVRRKAHVLGHDKDAAQLVSMLRKEMEAKPDHRAKISFEPRR